MGLLLRMRFPSLGLLLGLQSPSLASNLNVLFEECKSFDRFYYRSLDGKKKKKVLIHKVGDKLNLYLMPDYNYTMSNTHINIPSMLAFY